MSLLLLSRNRNGHDAYNRAPRNAPVTVPRTKRLQEKVTLQLQMGGPNLRQLLIRCDHTYVLQ